jgi:hypothetical protein
MHGLEMKLTSIGCQRKGISSQGYCLQEMKYIHTHGYIYIYIERERERERYGSAKATIRRQYTHSINVKGKIFVHQHG